MSLSKQVITLEEKNIVLITLHEAGRRSDSMKPAVLVGSPDRKKTRRLFDLHEAG